jgi:cohesin complex subunit SA-1/2
MISQALNLLGLHILWKARGLTAEAEPSPEEHRFRETLKEQRESLLEKLTEYAVGTQSNTAEGVKRSVCVRSVSMLLYLTNRQPRPSKTL